MLSLSLNGMSTRNFFCNILYYRNLFNYLVILLAFDEFVDEPADDEGLDGHGNLQQRDEGGPNIQSL